ncbi:hypothetical protein OHD16_06875 [Sphingobacterium sp. ML3W]|uniref:hypothetical protein n=1 Tax=Sphingobacterium sp. ML3W TaxID=1538644 RepID=UPI002499BCEA|nr:hypothetical protein [Sphingobacterium sp. ML3W]WFA79693.1 hypothetical protein OGI71_00015 [Sphingobacterium sp. ML3W]
MKAYSIEMVIEAFTLKSKGYSNMEVANHFNIAYTNLNNLIAAYKKKGFDYVEPKIYLYAKIRKDYDSKVPVPDILKKYSITRGVLYGCLTYCKNNNLTDPPEQNLVIPDVSKLTNRYLIRKLNLVGRDNKIREKYKNGASIVSIGNEFDLSPRHISTIVGVKEKKIKPPKPKIIKKAPSTLKKPKEVKPIKLPVLKVSKKTKKIQSSPTKDQVLKKMNIGEIKLLKGEKVFKTRNHDITQQRSIPLGDLKNTVIFVKISDPRTDEEIRNAYLNKK